MFKVRYVTGTSGKSATQDSTYATKKEALDAIFQFNAMRAVRKTRDPKTNGTLYIATRSK